MFGPNHGDGCLALEPIQSGLGEGMSPGWGPWGERAIPNGFPFPTPFCCCHGVNMAGAQWEREQRLVVERNSDAPLPTLELGPEVRKQYYYRLWPGRTGLLKGWCETTAKGTLFQ